MCAIVYQKSNYEFLKFCCTIFYVFYNVNYKICNIHVAVAADLKNVNFKRNCPCNKKAKSPKLLEYTLS